MSNNEKNNEDDFEKNHEIFDYLVIQFPDSSIGHHYDGRRKAEIFTLEYRKRQFLISFSNEFIKNTLVAEIPAKLNSFQLESQIQQGKAAHIIVTNSGLKFENQE